MNKKLIYKNFYFMQIFFSIFVITFLSILFILFKNNNLINNNSFLYTKATHNVSKYNNQNNSKDNSLIFSNLVNDRKLNPMNSDWDQKNETFGSYMERKFIDEQCNNMKNISECSEQEKQNAFRIDNYYYEALYTLSHNGKELFNVEDVVKNNGNLTEELELHVPFFRDMSFSVDLYNSSIVRANFDFLNNNFKIRSIKYRSKGSKGNIIKELDILKPGISPEAELEINDRIDDYYDEKTIEWIFEWLNIGNDEDERNGEYVFSTTKVKSSSIPSREEDYDIGVKLFEPDYDSIIYNNSPDSKKYIFDFSFTLEYKKKWLTNNKDHTNSPFIINPSYMFSSSHLNSSKWWKYNRTPMWIDFYFVNDDDSLELFETYIIENDIWEQDKETNENLLHEHEFNVENFVLESSSFKGKEEDAIIMELVSSPLGTQVSKTQANNKSYFMSKKISFLNINNSRFPYYFNFGSNYSDLNVEYLGDRKFEFKFKAHIINPEKVEGKKIVYKLNHNHNDNDSWNNTNFTFPLYSPNQIVDIKATAHIPNSENIQFAVEGLTDDDNPLYTWIIPEIPLNTNIIFTNTDIEKYSSGGIKVEISFYAAKELDGQKLWWNEKYITGYNFIEYLILSDDGTSDNGSHTIKQGINTLAIQIPTDRININNEKDNLELSFALGYTDINSSKPPPHSSTTNSFYDKKVIGEDNKVILPKSPALKLEEMIKILIILAIIFWSLFALLFSSGIGILVRSNKQTRMIISSMDNDIFNADDMEEDFELSL